VAAALYSAVCILDKLLHFEQSRSHGPRNTSAQPDAAVLVACAPAERPASGAGVDWSVASTIPGASELWGPCRVFCIRGLSEVAGCAQTGLLVRPPCSPMRCLCCTHVKRRQATTRLGLGASRRWLFLAQVRYDSNVAVVQGADACSQLLPPQIARAAQPVQPLPVHQSPAALLLTCVAQVPNSRAQTSARGCSTRCSWHQWCLLLYGCGHCSQMETLPLSTASPIRWTPPSRLPPHSSLSCPRLTRCLQAPTPG
jgi:hypothetical protein